METASIHQSTLQFLEDLSQKNDRNWFNSHKDLYLEAHQNMCVFVDDLISEMNKHDQIENTSGKKSLFRIYNDVRFSKDKSPYNPRFAFSLQRATKLKRGGYYVNIKPGNSFLACGFFGPNPEDLKRIRFDIAENHDQWKRILKLKSIQANFGELQGNAVATAPRGFQKDHPAIELIRHKQFIFRHDFTDKEIIETDFLIKVNKMFQSVRPYFDYMSEVLTTNMNGEEIV